MRDSIRGSGAGAEGALNEAVLVLLGVDDSLGRFAADGLSRVRCHVRETGGDADGVMSGGFLDGP